MNISNQPYQQSYLDQSQIYGTTGKDTLSIAGLTLNSMTVGLAEMVDTSYLATEDGILGLGLPDNTGSTSCKKKYK